MDYYQQFTLLPDPEFAPTALMNALIAKLHRALHDLGNGEVGVSFPEATKTLGPILRLHGNHDALKRLNDAVWYKGMRDHCEISSISSVPEVAQWRLVRRRQPTLTSAKLRRNIKRGSYDEAQAQALWEKSKSKHLKEPFVQLKSRSTGEPFRLFIEQISCDESVQGSFNRYGLSDQATVPWF